MDSRFEVRSEVWFLSRNLSWSGPNVLRGTHPQSAPTFEGLAHRTLASTISGSEVEVAIAEVRGKRSRPRTPDVEPQDADIQVLGPDPITIETSDGKVLVSPRHSSSFDPGTCSGDRAVAAPTTV